jgi:hypothetical protein
MGVAYGNNTFVAVSYSGKILTSSDGIIWTGRTSGVTSPLYRVIYGDNTFVAVGSDGTILTSPDAIEWTKRSPLWQVPFVPVDATLDGIAHGNNTFVAVGSDGTILTSPDGITWRSRVSGTTDHITGVAYGNNTFVAVANDGTVLTSPDGITWTPRVSGTSNSLSGVTYANNAFVVVGNHGTILQSAPGIALSPGWNFISLPKHPQDTAMAAVLAGVASKVAIVWGYDNERKVWNQWKPQGSTNTLTTMEKGKGYWMYMNSPATIDMTGWTASETDLQLYVGWNLVGYAGPDETDVVSELSRTSLNWTIVWNWDNASWKARHRFITNLPVESLPSFRRTKAYWIRVQGGGSDWTQ